MNIEEQSSYMLKGERIRVTPVRVAVLTLLNRDNKAFSLADLEQYFRYKYDRSTIFRCLKLLITHQLLKQCKNSEGVTLYFSRHSSIDSSCSHFQCNRCEQIVGLPQLPASYLEILGKNQIILIHLFVEGTCEKCLEN